MRSIWLVPVLGACAAFAGRDALAGPAPADDGLRGAATRLPEREARGRLARLPLAFETNRGQAPAGWDFLVRCRGYHALIASTGIVFSFDGAGLAMTVEDAARCVPSTRGFELPGRVNYFLGNDPSKWLSNVPIASGATYAEAAPGVTWSVGGRGRALEFAFDVAAGFDAPRLRFEGGRGLRVAADGSLRVSMPHGEAALSAPVAWQEVAGGRLDVAARFVVGPDGAVRIALAPKDPRRAVHVDPTVTYESYLGGTATEAPGGAAVDSSGNAYLTGSTTSTGFPTTGGAYDQSKADDGSATVRSDAFVTKINAAGTALVYSTYIGSRSDEAMRALAVDGSGNAYISGDTYYNDYPTTTGTYAPTAPSTSGAMGVLTELNSSGSGLVFSTYVQSRSWSMALGGSGSVYVLEGQGLSRYSAGGTSQIFATRIEPAVTIGSQGMSILAVASDAAGDAYVTGSTSKTNYPLTSGAYQTTIAGQTDAFVTKINAAGTVVYATLVGGSSSDTANAIGVNWNGQAFIAGRTTSSNYPTTSGAYRTTMAASGDGFVTRLNAAGTALKSSTFVGGTASVIESIRVHPSGACVVCGETYDANFPTSNAFQSVHGGATDYDGIAMKFNPDNSLAWASFCGGALTDVLVRCGMGPDGTVVLHGQTISTNFPTANAYQGSIASTTAYDDVFLLVPDTLPTTLTDPTIGTMTLPDWTVQIAYSRTIVPLGGLAPYAFTKTTGALPQGLALSASGLLSGTPSQTGTFTFGVHVDDVCEKSADGTVTIRINAQPAISSASMQGWTVGIPVDQAVPSTGGTAPLVYSIVSGTAPSGTTFGADGHLTGAPGVVGDTSFTVKLVDACGAQTTRAIVFRTNDRPTVTAAALPPSTESRPYVFQLGVTQGTQPFTWEVAAGNPPAQLLAGSGALSGTAKPAGAYHFTARAIDAAGVAAERDFDATIHPMPQVTTTALPSPAIGRPYLAHLAATGGTPSLAWDVQAGVLPAGVTLDADGTLHGDVLSRGSGAMSFRCRDAAGAVASRGVALDAAAAVPLAKRKSSETISFGPGVAAYADRFMELTGGCLLGITFAGGSKDGAAPQIRLTDAAGQTIDLTQWTKASKKSVAVKGFVVPATGRYFLTVTPAAGFEGKAKLGVTIAPQATWTAGATIGPSAPSEFRFSAPPGSLVSISAKAGKGSAALPKILSFAGADAVDLLPGGKVTEKGGSVTFSSKTALSGGDYAVTFSTRDANVGAVTWSVKLKTPKTYTFAMPDVAAGE